jgi:hypothetical protein
MKKKSIRFGEGDLIFYQPDDRRHHTVYVLLNRYPIPVGDHKRYFWHLFDTANQKRVTMYEKKMRHDVKKNPKWRHIKKSQPL